MVARRATRTSGRSEVALLSSPDGGALVRVIAGEVAGHAGPGLDVHADDARPRDAQPGCAALAPVARRLQRARLRRSARRSGTVGRRRPADRGPGQLARLRSRRCPDRRGGRPAQESRSPNLDVLVLGGRPIREPVAWTGPFVMNTREEVIQAVADYQAGRLGTIPAVHNAPTTSRPAGAAERRRPLAGASRFDGATVGENARCRRSPPGSA